MPTHTHHMVASLLTLINPGSTRLVISRSTWGSRQLHTPPPHDGERYSVYWHALLA